MADLIERDAVRKAMRDCETVTHSIGYSDMIAILDDAPAVNRWIPCSDKRPQFGKRVLGTTKDGHVVDVMLCPQGCEWFRNGDFYPYNCIIAWMPMPDAYEPPEVTQNE